MERKQCFADFGEYNIQENLHVYIEEEEKNKITLEFNHITTERMQQLTGQYLERKNILV